MKKTGECWGEYFTCKAMNTCNERVILKYVRFDEGGVLAKESFYKLFPTAPDFKDGLKFKITEITGKCEVVR